MVSKIDTLGGRPSVFPDEILLDKSNSKGATRMAVASQQNFRPVKNHVRSDGVVGGDGPMSAGSLRETSQFEHLVGSRYGGTRRLSKRMRFFALGVMAVLATAIAGFGSATTTNSADSNAVTRSNAPLVGLATLALVATLLSALVLASSAPALTGSCGQVVPPIPAGRHEEYTFFKVEASNVSCRVAMRVARRDVTFINSRGFHNYEVGGFDCRLVSAPVSGPTVRCTHGDQAVLGYNGGV